MERCDFVNDSLKLVQETEGLTFGTDALLLAGYISGKHARGCEIGSGSGIISLLLLTRDKVEKVTAIEVQEEYARLTEKNAAINSLSDRLATYHADVRDYKANGEFDLVYTNPPYMKSTSGKENALSKKNIARHEVMGDINDFCLSAKRLLKFGASFAVVYRPDRLCDLLSAMRAATLEPKRITFVHADTESEPSMVLIEARAGGKSGARVTRPLIIYADKEHKYYSPDMEYIMEKGDFPEEYKLNGRKKQG